MKVLGHPPIGLCTCGHGQHLHGTETTYTDRPNVFRFTGHGGCGHCACPQFTWKGWLRKEHLK
jgi:hypothetical protein